jgi:hypothetical protein
MKRIRILEQKHAFCCKNIELIHNVPYFDINLHVIVYTIKETEYYETKKVRKEPEYLVPAKKAKWIIISNPLIFVLHLQEKNYQHRC